MALSGLAGIATTFVLPPVAGALAATLAMGGLVWSQTQAPEQNPASQPILSYGD